MNPSLPAPGRRRLTSLSSEEWAGLAHAYTHAEPLSSTFVDALRQGREILEFILGPSGPQPVLVELSATKDASVSR